MGNLLRFAVAVLLLSLIHIWERPDLHSLQAVFSRSGFTSGYFDAKVDKTMFGFRKKEDVVSANEVFKPLAQLYHKQTPLIPVSMAFSMKQNEPVKLEIRDLDRCV